MKAAVTLLALFLHVCSSGPVRRSTNWLKQCRASTNISITALEVLPGGGWDNLRNMDMGRVMNLSYSGCQTTEDGLYLIPDEVFVTPHKETGVEANSEIISSWLEQKSSTSNTINADISFLKMLNGKFSTENKRIKTHQVKDSSTTARVQVSYIIYCLEKENGCCVESGLTASHPYIPTLLRSELRRQVYTSYTTAMSKHMGVGCLKIFIAIVQCVRTPTTSAIENNQTRNADYLSEKMVLDYGTHVITSVDAGATLVEDDYLRSSYVSDSSSDSSTIKAQAKLNFLVKLKFDIGIQSTQQSSTLKTYQSNIQYFDVQSHGGAPFYPGITLQKWQESTRNNLVAIDRSGIPLQYFINTNTIPDLPPSTIDKVAFTVGQAIDRYYKVNTRPGCVDINSKNFNFQANIDDSSCEGPATNLSFGGVYQTCARISNDAGPLCDKLAQKNIETGDFSCRPPYTPTLLRSEVRQEGYTSNDCHDERHSCWGVFHCNRTVCQDTNHVRTARIDTYWCSVNGTAPDNSGYLFGGIYSPSLLNPLTNAKSCPQNFIPVNFFSDGQMICMSKDYEAGTRFSVPFGGLFSCQSSNPLSGFQHRCPPKFSQHLASVSDGCEILYCVQSGLFTGGQLLPIHLPPFSKPPLVGMQATNTVMVMTEGDKSWVRVGETKAWKVANPQEIKEMQKLNPELYEMSSGEKAGVVFGVFGMIVLVVVVGVVLMMRRERLSGFSRAREYARIHGEANREEEERLIQQDEA